MIIANAIFEGMDAYMSEPLLVLSSADILLCPADRAWQEAQQFTLTVTAFVLEVLPFRSGNRSD